MATYEQQNESLQIESTNEEREASDSTCTDTEDDDEDVPQEEIKNLEDWSFVGDLVQHDLTLLVEGHKIHVSRVVLCLASPVFRAMLQSEFKEKNLQEVDLPEKKYEDFAEFLRCINPSILKNITGDNVYQVLPLATEYQVKVLEERCQLALIEVVRRDPDNVFKHIELAEFYDMEELKKICIYIASESSPESIRRASSYKVSAETLLKIYFLNAKRNYLTRQDENDLFQRGKATIRDQHQQNNHTNYYSTYDEHTVDCKLILRNYFDLNGHYGSVNVFRNVRLSHRFMPELLKKYTDILQDQTKRYLPGISMQEEYSLLPESVKQSLDIPEDKRKYLYSSQLINDQETNTKLANEEQYLYTDDMYTGF